MTWLVWRQHRSEAVLLAGLLALLVVGLLVAGVTIAGVAAQVGLGNCLTHHASDGCGQRIARFAEAFYSFNTLVMSLNVLPPLAGLFLGAPLVAREIERGTHRLAWTQSVTRGCWLTGHTIVVLGMSLVASAGTQLVLNHVLSPVLDASDVTAFGQGRMTPIMFDAVGIVPVAYTLFAAALGIACGVLLRRTLGAMVLVLVLFVSVRVAIGHFVRPNYVPPVTAMVVVESTHEGKAAGQPLAPAGSLMLEYSYVQADGIHSDTPTCVPPRPGCFDRYTVVYQPSDRFWRFQLTESGIYFALSALLVSAASLLVVRRAA